MVFAPTIHAQWWQWSGVQPLIPSQDNSANVSMNSFAMVWENQVDETTTAIYCRLTLPGSIPVSLIQIQGVQCTKPKIYFENQNFVLFETNLNGNRDIYGLIIDSQGNPVGEIQPVVTSLSEDHSLDYSAFNNTIPNLFWLEDDQLKTGNLLISSNQFVLSGVLTLDAGGCYDPAFLYMNTNRLLWTHHGDIGDFVLFSDYLFEGGWTTPAIFESAEQIQGLQSVKSIMFNNVVSLTYLENGDWFMKDYIFDYSMAEPDTLVPAIQQDHLYDFDTYYWLPGVKAGSENWWGFLLQTFAGNSGDHDEIFLNQDYDPNNYTNFSQLGVNCRNPRFYEGEWLMSGFNLYLTWEAFVDGQWQVYYSTTPIVIGGIEENEPSLIKDINISPNPFSDRLNISFDLEKSMPVTVDLIDVHGRVLMNLLSETCAEGVFSRTFDLTEFHSQDGLLFVRFGVDGKFSFKKVVKVR